MKDKVIKNVKALKCKTLAYILFLAYIIRQDGYSNWVLIQQYKNLI